MNGSMVVMYTNTPNQNAMRTFILLLLATLAYGPAAAQTGMDADSLKVDHLSNEACLLAMTDEEWTALGISTEQLDAVRSVQTACKTDCLATPPGAAESGRLSKATLVKHTEAIQRILSAEQFDKWSTWCSERPSKG
jgi:hypothetical protein